MCSLFAYSLLNEYIPSLGLCIGHLFNICLNFKRICTVTCVTHAYGTVYLISHTFPCSVSTLKCRLISWFHILPLLVYMHSFFIHIDCEYFCWFLFYFISSNLCMLKCTKNSIKMKFYHIWANVNILWRYLWSGNTIFIHYPFLNTKCGSSLQADVINSTDHIFSMKIFLQLVASLNYNISYQPLVLFTDFLWFNLICPLLHDHICYSTICFLFSFPAVGMIPVKE
jgi:hypothetical protein